MANSGYKDITVTKNHYIRFSWSLKSQDVANNKSTVNWNMKLVADAYGNMESSTAKTWKVVVNGTSYTGTVNITHNPGATVTLATGSTTITHSADGTKTFNYSFTQQIAITYAGSRIETFSGSGSGTLPTIPRASTVSATNCYIGDNTTITISRASSSFKHTLQYKISGQSSYTNIVSKTTATSYKYDTSGFAKDALNLLSTTGKTIKCTINCITYSGTTKLGEATTTITLTGKDTSLAPTLNAQVADTNDTIRALTNNGAVIVKYYSKPQVYFNVTPKYNATIKSYKVTNGSKSYTKDEAIFSDGVESNVFTFTVTDSRGFTTTQKLTLEKDRYWIEAIKPTITLSSTMPELVTTSSTTTFNFNFTVKGSCYNGLLSPSNHTNAETRIYYRYREVGSSTWLGENLSSGGWNLISNSVDADNDDAFNSNKTSYNATVELTGLNYLKAYELQGRIYNSLEALNSGTQTKKATPVFEWGENDFQFNVPVKMPNSNYYSQTNKTGGGLDMNNSDIIGLNGVYFADAVDSGGEGLFFYNSSTKAWDVLYAHQGKLYFKPDYSNNTTAYKMCITPGDVISLANNTPIYGFISNARKSILLSIPLNKPLVGVTGFKLSGTLQMRGVGGYIYNQASNKTEKTATFKADIANQSAEGIASHGTSITGQSLLVSFTFNSALTHNAAGTTATTNNSPVIIVPNGTLNITFT